MNRIAISLPFSRLVFSARPGDGFTPGLLGRPRFARRGCLYPSARKDIQRRNRYDDVQKLSPLRNPTFHGGTPDTIEKFPQKVLYRLSLHRSATKSEAKPRGSGADRADREAAQHAQELLHGQPQAGRADEGAAHRDDGADVEGHPGVVPEQEMQGPVVSDRKLFWRGILPSRLCLMQSSRLGVFKGYITWSSKPSFYNISQSLLFSRIFAILLMLKNIFRRIVSILFSVGH